MIINQIMGLAARLRNIFVVGEFQKRYKDGKIQVKTHNNRVVEKKEAFPYGFYAKAKSGKAFIFCQGGNMDGFEIFPVQPGDGVTPPELEEGDVTVYTKEGGCIICREKGDIEILGALNKDITIHTNNAKILLHGTGTIEMTGTSVSLLQAGQPAARVGDVIMSTMADDQVFWNWVTTISTIVGSLSGGSITPPPTITGKITVGSTKVTIG